MNQNENDIRILADTSDYYEIYIDDSLTNKSGYTQRDVALAAMQRVREEGASDLRNCERLRAQDAFNALGELNHLRAELSRLRECEAIVRELAEGDPDKYQMSLDELIINASEWVRKQDDNNQNKEEQP